MPTALTAETLAARYAARYPNAHTGTVDLSAAAGSVQSLEAGAAVRGFASMSGKLQWVRATENFYAGDPDPVLIGNLVQLDLDEATKVCNLGRAVFATDDEVKAAQTAPSIAASSGRGKS